MAIYLETGSASPPWMDSAETRPDFAALIMAVSRASGWGRGVWTGSLGNHLLRDSDFRKSEVVSSGCRSRDPETTHIIAFPKPAEQRPN